MSQTAIITGGVRSCPGADACNWSKRSFHSPARVSSAASASRYAASGFGLPPGSRSPGFRRLVTCSHSLKYTGSGRPVLSMAGRRGILVMPDSMASTRLKSLTIQGKGEPSG